MSATDSTAENLAVPPSLRPHRIYRGFDPDGVHDAVSGTIDPHVLRVTGSEGTLDTRLHGARVGAVTLAYLHYGAAVEIDAPGSAGCVCVHFPLGGRSEVRSGSQRILSSPSLAAVPNPLDPLRMRWSADAAHLIIRVDRDSLEGGLRSYLGSASNDPILPDLGLSLDGPRGDRWLAILELLQAEIEQGNAPGLDAPRPEARAAAIEDLVINSLLLLHPNNHWPSLHRAHSPARAPYVRRAIEYVRDHLDAPLTTSLLAQQAGVSGRSLQAGFARDLGCSPSAYVRDQRLAKAHAELAAAAPDQRVRVTEVALRAGFSHLGRFSRAYRNRYGEPPSATLRRDPSAGGSPRR